MRNVSRLLLLLTLGSTTAGAMHDSPRDPATHRWYAAAQVDAGRRLYAAHCAACHGGQGEGQPGWEERDESGYYPPPPLNGTGHSTNHPFPQLLRTLDTGGGPMGGTMPSFVDVLTDADKRAVIAFVQSLWPTEAYEEWAARHDD